MSLRFKVPLGDVPPPAAARHIGLSSDEFNAKLPDLLARGFPPPDRTTGNFDLDAIATWRRSRYPQLYLSPLAPAPCDVKDVVRERVARIRTGG
jgi:hypothetical protein